MKLKENQKTHAPREESLKKRWYLVDVKGQTVGRISTKIADLLRGKGKAIFTPQRDCGDYVIVINSRHIRLAGNKMDTKMYHWHTRYAAGLRTRTAREMMEKKPDQILYDAVWGMLPRNKLRKHLIRKLKIFPDDKHTMTAQKPESITL